MKTYDAVIIGIGQAGNPLADTLAKHYKNVAVIERRHPGGSCINYGCTPTKTMLASAHVAHTVKNAKKWGVETANTEVNFKKVLKRRDGIIQQWRKGIEQRLSKNKNITLIYGEARFSGKQELTIALTEGGEEKLSAGKIFVNVGTSPALPQIDGLEDTDFYTSRSIMKLKELPKHLLILGGSYIGIEYAQMFRRLGSKVTLLHDSDQLMPREDEDVALAIHEFLVKEGIQLHLKAKTKEIKNGKSGVVAQVELPGLGEKIIKATHLLVATGTKPSTEALNLGVPGIKTDDEGYIKVNNQLETSVSGVWALGDCKGGPEFTHISYDDYRILENQLFGDGSRRTDDRPVPYNLYTQPELGRIGLTEKQAKEAEKNYRVVSAAASEIGRTTLEGREEGFIKVLIDKDTDQLLGAACLMPRGGELAAMLQIAMMGQLPYQKLRDGVFAHPGYAEAWNTLFAKVEE